MVLPEPVPPAIPIVRTLCIKTTFFAHDHDSVSAVKQLCKETLRQLLLIENIQTKLAILKKSDGSAPPFLSPSELVVIMEIQQADAMIGRVIDGKYRILSRLDSTGKAFVFEAEQLHVKRIVALKVARRKLSGAEPSFERLSRIARMTGKVQHPNVAAVFDVGADHEGHVYLAMEMCPGIDLRRRVAINGHFSAEKTVEIGIQILDGLAAAHSQEVVHGILIPEYVMIRDGFSGEETNVAKVKLVGFGLYECDMGEPSGSSIGGSAQGENRSDFLAPEVIYGEPPSHRSDLYSAAALIFYALTGQMPWEKGALDLKEARRWYEHRVRFFIEKITGSDRMVGFFSTGLAPEPQDRFESAGRMKDALKNHFSGRKSEHFYVTRREEVLGSFRLVRMLARGGMGEVHLAMNDSSMGRSSALVLKTIRHDLTGGREFLDLFMEEVGLTSRLSHPNLVKVYEAGRIEGRYYMTLEYVVGKDLRRILERSRTDNLPVPVEVAVFIIRELCEGLAYIHRIQTPSGTGLVHADVSPSNVLVSFEGAVKIIDFGLARWIGLSGEAEEAVKLGKRSYLAPEQLKGEGLDVRTDIYAAGLLLFELLTRTRYQEPVNAEEKHGHSEMKAASLDASGMRGDLAKILKKALSPEKEKRYAKIAAMRDDLSEVLAFLKPRMSRDLPAKYLRELFPSEYKTETQMSQALFSKPPQAVSETALTHPDKDSSVKTVDLSLSEIRALRDSFATNSIECNGASGARGKEEGTDTDPMIKKAVRPDFGSQR